MPTEPVAIDTGHARLETNPPSGVTLLVNEVPSSYLDLADPTFLAFEYMAQIDTIAAHVIPGPVIALHLGAGGCALARAWHATRPGSEQLAVDIDASLNSRVRQWFDLPRKPHLRLRAQDARQAVARAKPGSYDVVVRDVFAGAETPPELTTPEFAAEVARALKPSGLYLANCADRPPLNLLAQELNTLGTVFQHVAVVAETAILNRKRYGNLVLAASNAPQNPFHAPQLHRALRALPVPARLHTDAELAPFSRTRPDPSSTARTARPDRPRSG